MVDSTTPRGPGFTNNNNNNLLLETLHATPPCLPVIVAHTTSWAFTALCLPRISFLFSFTTPPWDPVQLSSTDRPQHPFFEPLTRNPTHTLVWLVVGATFLQCWWAGWLRQWWIEIITIRGTDSERRVEKARYERLKFQAFKDAWLATITSSLILHVILVLFGAPIIRYIIKTYLLALLISIMIVYCPSFTFGLPSSFSRSTTAIQKNQTWTRLFVEFSTNNVVENILVCQFVGTIFGAWIGALPIALDWDRPWQAWPLTTVYGAIGGYILSSFLALIVNTKGHSQSHQRVEENNDKID